MVGPGFNGPIAKGSLVAHSSHPLLSRWMQGLPNYGAQQLQLPAWPIHWLFIGMPLWWLIGLYPLSPVVMCIPMLYFLVTRTSRILILPGVMPYVVFVAWLACCVVVLGDNGDALGFGMRLTQFASYAVILIYVINARKSLSVYKILRCLGYTYLWIVLGGYLGLFFPEGSLKFTVGMLLPDSLASNDYIRELFTPPFAEIQTPYGAKESFYRPSAPFLYANGWGAGIGILIPAVIGVAAATPSWRSKFFLVLGLVACVPPMIQSTNRGLLVGTGVAVAYVLLRYFFRGRILTVLTVLLMTSIVAITLLSVGVMEGITERQDAVDTTEGRGNLYLETWQRSLGSPLFGYGAPQPSYSSEIFVGTQGMLWSLMFCYGLIGCALFYYFLVSVVARTWRAPSDSALWIQAAVISAAFMGIFYGLDRHLPMLMLMIGLLLRERYDSSSRYWRTKPVIAVAHRASAMGKPVF